MSSWKLVGVEGVFADGARLNWPKIEDAFIEANLPEAPAMPVTDREGRTTLVPGGRVPMTDELRRAARANAQDQFTARVRHSMEPLGATMNGQRPVKIRTTLHRLDVPSLGRQLVQGAIMAVAFGAGAASSHNQSKMAVSTQVVDARTGAVLLSYPERLLQRQGGEAGAWNSSDPYAGDAVAGMLGDYRNDFGRWLVKG